MAEEPDRPGGNKDAESFVGSIARSTTLAIVGTDGEGLVTFWNSAAEKMFQRQSADMLGQPLDRIMPETFRPEHAAGMRRMREGGISRLSGKSVEVRGLRADGREFPIEMAISSWTTDGALSFGAIIQDVSERRLRETQLARLAHVDALTGLPNRAGLQTRITNFLEDAGAATLVLCDLQRLKEVNDTLGHAIGDALLQTVALRLARISMDQQVLGRFSGDVFAILIGSRPSPEALDRIGRDLLSLFQDPFQIDCHHIQVDVSVGIASCQDSQQSAEHLMVEADLALLQAKKLGTSAFKIFDEQMASTMRANQTLNDQIRDAIDRKEWLLYYQPQVDLKTRALTGVEALLRWQHPERGLLGPSEFITLLDRHFGADRVGRWILDEACRQLRQWRDAGFAVPRVAVNLFASQFRAQTLQDDIRATLARHDLAPTDLEVEITEKIALHSEDKGEAILRALSRMGLEISFDDFGTGFASLATLKQFPVTRLKIDRSFVHDVADTTSSSAIVQAIIMIGRSLGVDVIAEGIETERQRRQLIALGCSSGQGYLFGRPMPADAVQAGGYRLA